MKENENQFDEGTCSTRGCSASWIWLGITVILTVIAMAFIFGD